MCRQIDIYLRFVVDENCSERGPINNHILTLMVSEWYAREGVTCKKSFHPLKPLSKAWSSIRLLPVLQGCLLRYAFRYEPLEKDQSQVPHGITMCKWASAHQSMIIYPPQHAGIILHTHAQTCLMTPSDVRCFRPMIH